MAKELKIADPTIIQGEALKERGMGGIYGVGEGLITYLLNKYYIIIL